MRDEHWYNWAALVGILLVIVVGGFAIALTAGAPAPAAPAPTPTAPKVDYLYLTIAFNPATGADEYFPANFSVPAHTLVVVTITNYDNGTNPVPGSFEQVRGTVGESATAWIGGASTPVTYSSYSMPIAHTFTVASAPYNLNVPIPSAGDLDNPSVVQFSAYFNETGTFQWACVAPCDPGAMTRDGLMIGSLLVV